MWTHPRRTLALLLALLIALPAAAASKRQIAGSQFERAQKMRESLAGRPTRERTRREYNRVIESYRRVYYADPTSPKADPSVVAVAELLAEKGRAFEDADTLRDAIGQYEFLRREYPGSPRRIEALFTIAQIYRDDLQDIDESKSAFAEFLRRYPRHRLAPDARAAVEEMEAQTSALLRRESKEEESREERSARPGGKLPVVNGVRHWSTPDYTRIAIDLEAQVKYEAGRVEDPDRIFFDLHGAKLASELVGKTFEVGDGLLRKVRVAQYRHGVARIVLEVEDLAEYSAFLLTNPDRLIVDIHGKQPAVAAKTEEGNAQDETRRSRTGSKSGSGKGKAKGRKSSNSDSKDIELAKLQEPEVKDTKNPTTKPTFESVSPRPERAAKKSKPVRAPEKRARVARPASNGERSLIRALGLKIGRIVVDAGHGGHDTGTIGPGGLTEKDLVLDVALRLGRMLESRLGAEVVHTREDDTFVPLETRTAVANKSQADLFISIHANSSEDPGARGIETYYLNFTSSPEALEVAARENAVSEKSIHELQDLVKKIALKEKIEESREFAAEVQHALWNMTAAKGARDRGVKKAPFIVLIGANMPSVLAEISFLSNPADEKRLQTAKYRQKLAEALYRGISKYASGLSGVKMASKLDDAGQ